MHSVPGVNLLPFRVRQPNDAIADLKRDGSEKLVRAGPCHTAAGGDVEQGPVGAADNVPAIAIKEPVRHPVQGGAGVRTAEVEA